MEYRYWTKERGTELCHWGRNVPLNASEAAVRNCARIEKAAWRSKWSTKARPSYSLRRSPYRDRKILPREWLSQIVGLAVLGYKSEAGMGRSCWTFNFPAPTPIPTPALCLVPILPARIEDLSLGLEPRQIPALAPTAIKRTRRWATQWTNFLLTVSQSRPNVRSSKTFNSWSRSNPDCIYGSQQKYILI